MASTERLKSACASSIAFLLAHDGEEGEGFRTLGIELDGLLHGGDGFLPPSLCVVNHADVRVGEGGVDRVRGVLEEAEARLPGGDLEGAEEGEREDQEGEERGFHPAQSGSRSFEQSIREQTN